MISIEEIRDFKALKSLSDEWNKLVLAEQQDISLTYEWIETLWEVHLKRGSIITLLIREDEKLLAVIPLYKDKQNIKGVRITALSPIANLYSYHGSFIIGDRFDLVVEKMFEYISSQIKWDVFTPRFSIRSLGYDSIIKYLNNNEYNYNLWPANASPYLSISSVTLDEFLKSKSGNFRSNLKRKEKKLRKSGDVVFERCVSQDCIDQAMENIFNIEKHSWKTKAYTAITSNENQKEFYYKMAKKAARAGWLSIYLLKVDNKPIAFDYALIFNKTYFMMKTSFDGRYGKSLSPGNVLRWFTIQEAFKQDLEEYDFLGESEPYKLQWTDTVRPHNAITIYNKKMIPNILYYSRILKNKIINRFKRV